MFWFQEWYNNVKKLVKFQRVYSWAKMRNRSLPGLGWPIRAAQTKHSRVHGTVYIQLINVNTIFLIYFFNLFLRFGHPINKVAPFICLVIGSIRSRPSQYYLTAQSWYILYETTYENKVYWHCTRSLRNQKTNKQNKYHS